MMRNFQIFMLCCFAVACVGVLGVTEVTGNAGEDVSFRCSGNWTAESGSEPFNMFLCKGTCSRENAIIQSPGTTAVAVRTGRYSLQPSGDGALQVNIRELEPADAGRYYCGVGHAVIVLYQEVKLKVRNHALTSATLPAAANTGGELFLPTAEPSPAFTRPPPRGKTNPRTALKLSETMVVIIISVSLALLVCAIIPLIFYIHWRSSSEAQSKRKASQVQSDRCDQDVCSHGAVELQAMNVPESGAQRATHQPLHA